MTGAPAPAVSGGPPEGARCSLSCGADATTLLQISTLRPDRFLAVVDPLDDGDPVGYALWFCPDCAAAVTAGSIVLDEAGEPLT